MPDGLIDPIAEYDHDEGIAIIGGFVYRGDRIPALRGKYVFGEFAPTFSGDGRLFYLDDQGTVQEFPLIGQSELGLFLLGMGQDADGEVYVLANSTGTPFSAIFGPTGVVLRIAPLTGDMNSDGAVGPADLAFLLGNWGPIPPNDAAADLNGDGNVGPADLAILLGNWG